MGTTKYETVIGLEVHVELKTDTKIFCGCRTQFGAEPNTLCCPVCMGLPGSMPTLNRKAVELAVKAGLALNCRISKVCRMDRKQYFYPDLPKAYQISQEQYPICENGYLELSVGGRTKKVGITRIHIEEDAGKLLHEGEVTKADYNRSGVPLIEIVSEPDMRSGEEAAEYVRELRRILLACGVSDCKMQEGSLRCDVNVSIRPVGSSRMGTRTEIKNVNSFSFIEKAVAYEAGRQAEELETTGQVIQRTIRFLPSSGITRPMREKKQAKDYRFIPEPDLRPFVISEETVERIRKSVPELPTPKRKRLISDYGISEEDAGVLVSVQGLADYFEAVAVQSGYPSVAASLILTDLLRFCPEDPFSSSVSIDQLSELCRMAGEQTVNRSVAKKLLLQLKDCGAMPKKLAEEQNLTQINDMETVKNWVLEVCREDEKSVGDYRKGKKNAAKALQGKLMAKSRGRANPVLASELLFEELDREKENA